ncbi:induced myeloid leukemia cell differentiation protein Mcl-1b [Anoplopoma fimbria]|uniref:induced myeloid leukemia cell differentiation protein Mcl-1b n=1 Tax=Anoplopoma fimbria TaxID=229290 RepID=UPI0023ECAEA5|nr:induced myeloid leukemia cell differentiation protein Mcl-1b [Anoplopoma fimbria]
MNIIPSTKRAAFMSCIILPQNGVGDGPMRYGSGDASMGVSGKETHAGNAGLNANDPQRRPKNLALTATATNGGYAQKTHLVDPSSLPCTPELDGESDVTECPAALDADTRRLVVRCLRELTGLCAAQWNQSRELGTMKRVVEDLLEKHRYAFNGMINNLSLDERSDDASFVRAIAKSLFADGTTNWGRIASLVAFGAVVCQYLKEKGRGNCVELVGQEISTYLLSDQRDWLVKNNGWDGFVEFFRVADPESTVRNTLMAVAGFAGIGATLALLIR